MSLGLLANGVNSIVHGMEHYGRGRFDATHFKFAVQHLAHGTELLLKERLAREHALLIWEDVSKPGGRAVGWETAVNRLVAAGVDLSRYIDSLKHLRALRNRIEHFEFELNEKETRSALGGVLDFLFEFPVNELGVNLQLAFPAPKTWQRLLRLRELRKQAEDTAETMLQIGSSQYRQLGHACMVCGGSYVVCSTDTLAGDDAMCLLCGHRYEVVECESCEQLKPMATSVVFHEEGGPVCLCRECIEQMQEEASRYEDYGFS